MADIKSKYVPVNIDAETYAQLKAYSVAMGQPITQVLKDALPDWLGTIGATKLKAKLESKSNSSEKRAKLLNIAAYANLAVAALDKEEAIPATQAMAAKAGHP